MKLVDWDLVSYLSLYDDDYEYDDDGCVYCLVVATNQPTNSLSKDEEKEPPKSMDRNLPIHSRITMNHELIKQHKKAGRYCR